MFVSSKSDFASSADTFLSVGKVLFPWELLLSGIVLFDSECSVLALLPILGDLDENTYFKK